MLFIFFSALSEIKENVSSVESAFFKISVAFSNLLTDTGPRAGRLSAVNTIGTQLRDPINSRLT